MECYSLFSGSSGNCIYLKEAETELLIDAGGNCKRIQAALQQVGSSLHKIDAVLITHEHVDHTAALPVLLKKFRVPVYCQEKVAKELYLDYLTKKGRQEATAFARCVKTVEPGMEYEVGSVTFAPFQTPHDSVDSQGFVLQEGALGVATDLGHVSPEVRENLLTCERVILEANHDLDMLWNGHYPYSLKERVASEHGHLSNADCAAFLGDLIREKCRDFTLFHLSQDNNTVDLALSTCRGALSDLGAAEGKDYDLRVANRYEVTRIL